MPFDVACFPGAYENQWAYVLQHFTPRTLYTFPGHGGQTTTPFQGAVEVASVAAIPSSVVLFSPQNANAYPGETSVSLFIHPIDCCYLFGADNDHQLAAHMNGATLAAKVYIPTDTTDHMWSWVAAAVAIFDRRCKGG